MGLFDFLNSSKNKTNENASFGHAKELDLFKDDIASPAFLEKVKALPDVNRKFQKGMNLLHFTCEYNQLGLARELINLNINVEEKNNYGNTPLWTAVFNSNGNYDLVDLLLAHGANPNSVNDAQNTPLKFAETIDDKVLVEKLKRSAKQ